MCLWPLTNILMCFCVYCLFQLIFFSQISIIRFTEAFTTETSFQNSSCLFAWERSLYVWTSENIIILLSSCPQLIKHGQDDFYTKAVKFLWKFCEVLIELSRLTIAKHAFPPVMWDVFPASLHAFCCGWRSAISFYEMHKHWYFGDTKFLTIH